MKVTEFLSLAETEGQLAPGEATRVAAALEEGQRSLTPWYLQVLVIIGAWFASLLLLAFLSLLLVQIIGREPVIGIFLGVFLIFGAGKLPRAREGVSFLGQAALAVSAAGHALALFWLSDATHSFGASVPGAFILAAVFYPLNRSWLHRFLAWLTALLLSSIWIISRTPDHFMAVKGPPTFLLALSLLIHTLVGAWLLLRAGSRRKWRPLGYAVMVSWLTLLVPTMVQWSRFDRDVVPVPEWPIQVVVTAALLGAVAWAARGLSLREHWLATVVGTATVLGLGGFATPPIAAALVLLVVGFALQEKPLLVLGSLSLPVFLLFYYYNLHWSLRQKSQLLMATGAALLLVQQILTRLRRPAP